MACFAAMVTLRLAAVRCVTVSTVAAAATAPGPFARASGRCGSTAYREPVLLDPQDAWSVAIVTTPTADGVLVVRDATGRIEGS